MLISPTAVFDEERFVFKGSCAGVGAVFVKDVMIRGIGIGTRLQIDFIERC